jgi:fructokinase
MFVVCGEALYDLFANGKPDPGGKVVLRAVPGGSPFNVAIGLGRMDVSCGLLSAIPRDVLGTALRARLATENVSARFLLESAGLTTLSLVGLNDDGSPSYSFYQTGQDERLSIDDLPPFGADVVGMHLGSYAAVAPVTSACFQALAEREQDRLVTYDLNVRLTVEPRTAVWKARVAALLPVVSALKASDEDLTALWPDRDPVDVARECALQGPALVVLTRGPKGAVAFHRSGEFAMSAPVTEVNDTVGAGDAFQAQLIAALLEHGGRSRALISSMSQDEIATIIRRAIWAASHTCRRQGADPPTAADIAPFLSELGRTAMAD